ncbi:MAG TPA: hypothetical protein PLV92_27965, partial [Pirellulaceae bacterium]|nr:hypothetical protein [Pirellulaceae bacterium]
PGVGVVTGDTITASARILFDTAAPQDTNQLANVVDAVPPTTTLSATPLAIDSFDYSVAWRATDDALGSGVKHVTVYVSEDGGPFTIWRSRVDAVETGTVYSGRAGHRYDFLALATDQAGNREQAPPGIASPSDGGDVNLGASAGSLNGGDDTGSNGSNGAASSSTSPPPGVPADATPNPLFVDLLAAVPAPGSAVGRSEFSTVFQPFSLDAFATGVPTSFADIGPMAIAERSDGRILVSGGAARNEIYSLPTTGGDVGLPLNTLPYPIYDLAWRTSPAGATQLWAATGGGPLLQLDPNTGAIIGQYGDGFTQTVAVEPSTGDLYVSSGDGIERLQPETHTWSHFSNLRVGNLAFSPSGELWGAAWPQRGDVVRFNHRGQA